MDTLNTGMRKMLAMGMIGMDFGWSDQQIVLRSRSQPFRGGQPRAMTYQAPRRRTTLHPTNGKRECERRQRQIAAGSLRAANGLVVDSYFNDANAHPGDYGLAS